MALFGKKPSAVPQPSAPPTIAETLQQVVQTAGKPSLFALSDFVKQVDCSRCGAPKRLPSRTAYLYCDHCGALVDYDFRMANLDTNAGITNTVFHQLIAPLKMELTRARAIGDKDCYRELHVLPGLGAACPAGGCAAAACDVRADQRVPQG
jgi:hypothetical protein